MHKFEPKDSDKSICRKCNRGIIIHMVPECECGAKDPACEVFGNPLNPKSLLLCPSCTAKEIAANNNTLKKTEVFAAEKLREANVEIERARAAFQTISYNGDAFNAATVPLIDVKKVIDSETGTVEEKKYKFNAYLAEQYAHLSKVIFEKEQKHKEELDPLTLQKLVVLKMLREQGDDIRKDIRAAIAAADANYQPPAKVVRPRMAPVNNDSPLEKLIKKFMLSGCTRQEAEDFIRKGQEKRS